MTEHQAIRWARPDRAVALKWARSYVAQEGTQEGTVGVIYAGLADALVRETEAPGIVTAAEISGRVGAFLDMIQAFDLPFPFRVTWSEGAPE